MLLMYNKYDFTHKGFRIRSMMLPDLPDMKKKSVQVPSFLPPTFYSTWGCAFFFIPTLI